MPNISAKKWTCSKNKQNLFAGCLPSLSEHPLPDLLKVALLHYQFYTIHPFLDGSGRVGRLIIPLYHLSKGIIKRPVLYLSDFFERHRTWHYDNLMRVRTHHDLLQWFRFFLAGIAESAQTGIETFDGILRIPQSIEKRLKPMGSRSADARKLIEHLYANPITDAYRTANVVGKSNVSAYKLFADLEKAGILHEMTGGQRIRMYLFKEYVDLFQLGAPKRH